MANSQADLEMMRLISGLNIFFLVCGAVASIHEAWAGIWVVFFIALALSSLVSAVLPVYDKFKYQHQFLMSVLLVIETMKVLFLLISFSVNLIITDSWVVSRIEPVELHAVPITFATVICTLLVNALLLHLRLKAGFSKDWADRNLSWLILAVSFLAIVKGSRGHESLVLKIEILRAIIGLLVAISSLKFFSSLLVELSYLACLKSVDKTYWVKQGK